MGKLLLAPLALAGVLGLYAIWRRRYAASGQDWKGLLLVGVIGTIVVFGVGPHWDGIRARMSAWFQGGSGGMTRDAGGDDASSTDVGDGGALDTHEDASGAPPAVPGACPAGMALIQGGFFVAGEVDAASKSLPHVRTFCLDETKVTLENYRSCVAAGQCPPAKTVFWSGIGARDKSSGSPRCVDSDSAYVRDALKGELGKYPINCVDWTSADAFCRARGGRLPTEAEFEWAARNGSDATDYPWLDNQEPRSEDEPERLCWEARSPPRYCPCPVGAFKRGDNKWGVHDLAGGLFEWTATPGREPTTRVYRGSRCGSTTAAVVRSSYKSSPPFGPGEYEVSLRSFEVGFRCASSVQHLDLNGDAAREVSP